MLYLLTLYFYSMDKVLKSAKKKIKNHLRAQEYESAIPICEVIFFKFSYLQLNLKWLVVLKAKTRQIFIFFIMFCLLFQELISNGVQSADLYFFQGICFFKLGKPLSAVTDYKKALGIQENHIETLKGLCQCLLSTNEELVDPKVHNSFSDFQDFQLFANFSKYFDSSLFTVHANSHSLILGKN